MKTLFNSILVSFVILLMNACSSETELKPDDQSVNYKLLEKFTTLSVSEQKIAYSSLSKYDKYYFWTNKTLDYIATHQLTSDQKNALDLLIKEASPDVFVSNSQAKLRFIDYIDTWGKKAILLFPEKKDRSFAVIWNNNFSSSKTEGTACNCSDTSVFINDCSGNDSCLIAPNNSCTANDSGCGFWWLHSCDMICAGMS